MKYYLDLFSPETAAAFMKSDQTVSGFRQRQQKAAERIVPGDHLICYMTRVSRWIGILEVVDGPFESAVPIFYPDTDPFIVRFHVKRIAWLDIEKSIPIHEDKIWNTLSFTKGHKKESSSWTGKVRASLTELSEHDGKIIEKELLIQLQNGTSYPLTEIDKRRIKTHIVRIGSNQQVEVIVPDEEEEKPAEPAVRQSIQMQAKLCQIGERMKYKIWVPKNDRGKIAKFWKPDSETLLDNLPLNYDETTLSTIEQIDVLWIHSRSIIRAFEVEHTTSIYSGILRMADLMALQPNMDIKAHIVAPEERRDKVLHEIKRPVFSLLERGPLANSCSYLSYEAIDSLYKEKLVHHMTDSVLEEFAEYSEI